MSEIASPLALTGGLMRHIKIFYTILSIVLSWAKRSSYHNQNGRGDRDGQTRQSKIFTGNRL